MAQRYQGAVLEREAPERRDGLQADRPLLPPKAEVALREAGLWTEEFVRQLPHLDRTTLDALSVLGAWDDLDWDDMATAFERMRHETPPSSPVEL
jgi:hypothetical protein